MFEIAARIDDEGDGVGCFDPRKVVSKLIRTFPGEAVACLHDYAWKDYDSFKQKSDLEGVSDTLEAVILRAERDAHRRGPLFVFRLYTGDGQVIRGAAERYVVRIWSGQPIPPDLRERFIAFLDSLLFGPVVTSSVRFDGNEVSPA